MVDWTKPMTQSFEYTIVDPGTWKDKEKIDTVKSCTITRDSTMETLGSATIDVSNMFNECYVRIYLVVIQNGLTTKLPLGTFLVQTPSSTFNGLSHTISMDAYTPLIELKEKQPPLGYSLMKGDNIMDYSYQLINENARAPVVRTRTNDKLQSNFVANVQDTWLTFSKDLVSAAKYDLDLDELGRILFAQRQRIETLQPVWTYTDDNSSILYPEITMNHDIYGIPNVVEVVYSKGTDFFYAKAVNDNPNSPVSTISRGREIPHRITDVNFGATPTQEMIEQHAKDTLEQLSSIEYSITYTHGYCGTRVGDCVRLNYNRAGLSDIKAKIVSQSITCRPGCPVSETAVFTTSLWR